MPCFNPRSHAGSDGDRQSLPCREGVSIHAPTRGATCAGGNAIVKAKFQSTLPRGERPLWCPVFYLTGLFQSTLPRGERHSLRHLLRHLYGFNPRSHAGSDSSRRGCTRDMQSFNPRSHAGSDCIRSRYRHGQGVSIHAPTRGATPKSNNQIYIHYVSIHAPTRGATNGSERVGQ